MIITKYTHHGAEVSVQTHLQGSHREHCLCFQGCVHFRPSKSDNCGIAESVFKNCKNFNIVTPVWECPKYEKEVL